MRVLVVDYSGILPWRVERAAPPEIRVEAVTTFEEATRRVREQPPNAAVVSVPTARLPWLEFQRLCAGLHPPVPVLYESCLEEGALEARLAPAGGMALFLSKPASPALLEQALAMLLAEAAVREIPPRTPA